MRWSFVFIPKLIWIQVVAALCLTAAAPARAYDFDRGAAVILAYQRVGEDLYPGNNIAKDQFAMNIEALLTGGYHIAPLAEIVAALKTGAALPNRTVAITFNGGYRSALENAFPLLLENNIPFTVFFAPDQATSDNPQYMSWDDLRRLSRDSRVTIGLHPASYTRLTEQTDTEIKRQVNNAIAAARKELRIEPEFFAYPFGEYTKAFRDIAAASGFTAAFAQQSGVAYGGSDLYALPRFAITESYAGEDRFNMVASALPLAVSDITPDNPHITAANNPPIFGFTLDDALVPQIAALSCFISEHNKPAMQVIGKNRIELRVPDAFTDERVRMNCTMPGPAAKAGDDPRWRWFGVLISVDQPDESSEDGAAGPFPN